nr:MAG: hypothetical protein [Lokiarchaeota virus Skoll Meg22_1214]
MCVILASINMRTIQRLSGTSLIGLISNHPPSPPRLGTVLSLPEGWKPGWGGNPSSPLRAGKDASLGRHWGREGSNPSWRCLNLYPSNSISSSLSFSLFKIKAISTKSSIDSRTSKDKNPS